MEIYTAALYRSEVYAPAHTAGAPWPSKVPKEADSSCDIGEVTFIVAKPKCR